MNPSIQHISLKRKPRSVSTFLKKTYDLLNEPKSNDCIKWAPNGIGFIVVNEDLFSKTVLPKYFKHSNYSSFVRQLNMYNFHKIRQTNSESYFHHECFDRENKGAMSEIRRKPEKKKRRNFEDEDEEMMMNGGNSEDSIPLKHKESMKRTQFEEKENKARIKEFEKVNKNKKEQFCSEEKLSIHQIIRENQEEKNSPYSSKNVSLFKNSTTKNLFSETFHLPEREGEVSANYAHLYDQQHLVPFQRPSQKNINSIYSNDNISINEQVQEKIPFIAAKDLFYPSTNNLFPLMQQGFSTQHPNTFSIFY